MNDHELTCGCDMCFKACYDQYREQVKQEFIARLNYSEILQDKLNKKPILDLEDDIFHGFF